MPHVDADLKDALNAYLRRHHADICRHWFDEIEPLEIEGGVLRLLVTEPVRLRYLQRSCIQPFTEAAQAATGRLLAVRFVGTDGADDRKSGSAPAGRDTMPGDPLPGFDDQMVLSPDYTFDTFVVGPGNRLAHAAAQAVTGNPGRAYNPFFIHGGVGLGKTHLLHAICQTILKQRPSAKILYLSCNTFIDLFHECVKAGRMHEFRHRFRTADMLVIDDIHFLSKREQTQEEFFHTFNSLYQTSRQIVLSSDAAPNEIPDLEERLVSRFNCGLVARMDRPCYETRVSILRAKAKLHNLELPDEVPAYIAARIDSNIRELEGALTKVRGYAMANGVAITLDAAKAALSEDPTGAVPNQPSIQTIIDAVTKYYDIKLSDLMSKRRHKSVALPRQVCMWLARKYTRYSLEEIGGYFGGRDHTTVLHAIRTIGSRRDQDPDLGKAVERLEGVLGTRAE
ncbi:MAG: chromosomal replication initiator protein DnaA [Phycisphaerales bacterium]|nr:chromosomal replication initiator protein DnaA [Phycisphaerales bacterium]